MLTTCLLESKANEAEATALALRACEALLVPPRSWSDPLPEWMQGLRRLLPELVQSPARTRAWWQGICDRVTVGDVEGLDQLWPLVEGTLARQLANLQLAHEL